MWKNKELAFEQWPHRAPFRAEREIKGQLPVHFHFQASSWQLGHPRSFLMVLFKMSLRDNPQRTSYGKFTETHRLCWKITTNPELVCLYVFDTYKFYMDL